MTKKHQKERLSVFINKQREDRYQFHWQQHQAMLAFKAKQIKARQQFINDLTEGGDQC
jgi:hypothetical protein